MSFQNISTFKESEIMCRSEISRRQFSDNYQSLSSKEKATWANNHNGWSKMKKRNRRLFKKKFRKETKFFINEI